MIYTWYMYVFVCICPMCRDTKWTATSPFVLHDVKVGPCVLWPPRSSTFIQRSPPCSGRSMKRPRMPSRKPCLVLQKCHFLSNSFAENICKPNMFIDVCHLHKSLKPSDFLLAVRPASNQKGQAHRKTHLKLKTNINMICLTWTWNTCVHQDCLTYSPMSTEENPMKLAELASALAYFEYWNCQRCPISLEMVLAYMFLLVPSLLFRWHTAESDRGVVATGRKNDCSLSK